MKDGAPDKHQLEAAEFRKKVMELRTKGHNTGDIARLLKCSTTTVTQITKKYLAKLEAANTSSAGEFRQLELLRCDYYLACLDQRISRGEPRAVEVALRVSERRAKLLGLDQADKVLTAHLDLNRLTPPELLAKAQQLGISVPPPPLPRLLPGERELSPKELEFKEEKHDGQVPEGHPIVCQVPLPDVEADEPPESDNNEP